jgi:hypothetical protein
VAPAVSGAGAWELTGAWRSHSRRAYFANEQPGSRFEGKINKDSPVDTRSGAAHNMDLVIQSGHSLLRIVAVQNDRRTPFRRSLIPAVIASL